MQKEDLLSQINTEFAKARESRSNGNEGMARVCARRAAGIALGAFITARFGRLDTKNAFLNLKWFAAQDHESADLRDAAARLSTHVGVDHALPFAEDPLEDAQTLIRALLSRLS